MKSPNVGDYLLWGGELAKIIGETDRRQVIIELLEDSKCPHCGENLGKEQIHMIVSSPLFQEKAEKLPTILDEDNLIVN